MVIYRYLDPYTYILQYYLIVYMNHIGEGVTMGRDVKVWHFSYIGDETVIGDGTSIGSLAHIDHHVRIGKNCRIQDMVYLPPGTVIGDNVFIGPGVILTNDPFRARYY